jgi:hypothetical protein
MVSPAGPVVVFGVSPVAASTGAVESMAMMATIPAVVFT